MGWDTPLVSPLIYFYSLLIKKIDYFGLPQCNNLMEIKKKKRMRLKLKMLKDILAHHPFYLKGLQGAKLKS